MTKMHPYIQGALWSLLASAISAFNDVLAKKMGIRIGGPSTLFFRFFFSAVFFLPYVFWNKSQFKTRHHKTHALRGGLFALAMLPWYCGIIHLPLPLITVISFATPLFVSVISMVWIKETMGKARTAALFIGFAGIVISAIGSGRTECPINASFLMALGATFLFGLLDVMNKRLLNMKENFACMVFYSALWTCLFSLLWTYVVSLLFGQRHWESPDLWDMGRLALLGLCANGLLACLLKASDSVRDLSSLQPLRYVEFVFSCMFSIFFFKQYPQQSSIIGMLLIVPAAIYLTKKETS